MSFVSCPSGSLIASALITCSLHDKHSALLYSKQCMHSLQQGVPLVLTFGKKFQAIHKQQVIQFKSLVALFYLISTSPNFPPDALNPNFHDFMLLYKKSCILFTVPNISKTAMRYFVIGSIHVIARLVCLLLQSLNTVLSVNSWSFVPWLPKRHPFHSDGSTFSLSW